MLTGDAQSAAEGVARELGLDEFHAELLPGDKVDQVERLLAQKQPRKSCFCGGRHQRCPVLSRADIGVAMGALGSDAAIEAADIVLMDDDLSKLAQAVRIARKTLSIVRQNIVFALAVKGLVLVLSALGYVGMWWAVFADVGVYGPGHPQRQPDAAGKMTKVPFKTKNQVPPPGAAPGFLTSAISSLYRSMGTSPREKNRRTGRSARSSGQSGH